MKRDYEYFLSTITHADKDLAKIQARAMEIGYNHALTQLNLLELGEEDLKNKIQFYTGEFGVDAVTVEALAQSIIKARELKWEGK